MGRVLYHVRQQPDHQSVRSSVYYDRLGSQRPYGRWPSTSGIHDLRQGHLHVLPLLQGSEKGSRLFSTAFVGVIQTVEDELTTASNTMTALNPSLASLACFMTQPNNGYPRPAGTWCCLLWSFEGVHTVFTPLFRNARPSHAPSKLFSVRSKT